ncbi:MAG: hypothetical protein HXY45_02415 [Syntrophaceae bacterium]|nr:hypothetical protein [Syntrophaceae bacterium]
MDTTVKAIEFRSQSFGRRRVSHRVSDRPCRHALLQTAAAALLIAGLGAAPAPVQSQTANVGAELSPGVS